MDIFDSETFYNLMQNYRHASLTDQSAVVVAFEAVKAFCREAVSDVRSDEAMEARDWFERNYG